MKYTVSFCVYATMEVDLDDDVDLEQYERDFGNCDNPFDIQQVEYVHVLSLTPIKEEVE